MPIRTCIGCKTRSLDSELLRVVAVDGVIVVDNRRAMPGRGAWLHVDQACITAAASRQAFSRALRVGGLLDASAVQQLV